MEGSIRKSGIEAVGDIAWGEHLCQFYQAKEDILEILVPYFKAGLENNEFCMWVVCEPLKEAEAKEAMKKAVANFDRYMQKGQIEIISHREWYLKGGFFDLKRVLNGWLDKLNGALSGGYDGMRITGDTAWLEKKDWGGFKEYEETINNTLGRYKLVAICTYRLDRCSASDILDVMKNHHFAFIKREGRWEVIEPSFQRKTEKMLMELLAATKDAIIAVDTSRAITLWNPAAEEVFGYTAEEAIGKSVDIIVPDELKALHKKAFEEAVSKGALKRGGISIETQGIRKDKGRVVISICLSLLKDPSGNVSGVVGIVSDISKQAHLVDELKKLSRAIEQSASMVVITDAEGAIEYVNSRFTQVTGYAAEEVIGKKPRFLKSGEMAPEAYKGLWEAIKAGSDWRGEFHNKKKDGKFFWASASISPIRNAAGAVTHFIAVEEDVTRHKEMEEALVQANDNLKRLAQAKAEFVSVVSHELRTPLTSIKEAISLVLNGAAGKVEKAQEKFLTIAKNNIDRLAFLINDILDFSKFEAGRMPMRRTKADLNKVIYEVFETFHMQAQARGVSIQLLLADDLPQVWIDIERMSQVMANLLSNAIKFTPDNGRITIKRWHESFEGREWELVSVEDSGPGIAKEDIPRLFERFSQLDTTMTRRPGGTGLGLAISKNIVEFHGGDIWAESTLGVGSKFTFRIPVYKKDIELNFLLDEAIERSKVNHIKASVIIYKLELPASLKEEDAEKVLLKAEDMISELIRTPEDKVVRYKDHVFVAVLASADRTGAAKITSRINDKLRRELVGGKTGISFDAKVIVYPDDGANKEELLARLE